MKRIFYLRRNKFSLLITGIILVFLSLIDGTNDTESIKMYMEKLQTLSEHRIDSVQEQFVVWNYVHEKNRHPNQEKRLKTRREFSKMKKELKQQWCDHYKMQWPTEMKITSSGEKITKNFEAHHIIPINAGGVNRMWNLTPLSNENHHELHSSIEEHACFSHDSLEKKSCRVALRIKIFAKDLWKQIENYKNTHPAAVPLPTQ